MLEAATLIAATGHCDLVAAGRVHGGHILLETWQVEAHDLGQSVESRIALDADHPAAVAALSLSHFDRGRGSARSLPPEVDLVVPLVSVERAIGVVGLRVVRTGDRGRALQFARDVAMRATLAIEYAALLDRSRFTLQETVSVLAALIEGRDTYTERHCVNLAEMSLAVGIRMGLDADRLDLVTYGGLLHDIGKIAIPDSILKKPGALTEREFEEMKTHAGIGEEILQRISSLANVGPIVGQHHERFDGTGYPRGLSGESIVVEARILAVADAFDAMTTTRPYRAALSWTRAIEEIASGSGSQFDPDVSEVFLRYLQGEEAQWKTASPS
jgi:putative nucleotidyltransferase with HDIG domain